MKRSIILKIIFLSIIFIITLSSVQAQQGELLLHSFLGSSDYDLGRGMVADDSGNVYLVGYSESTWGTPILSHNGDYDVFVACLDSEGDLVWNTFLGTSAAEHGIGIALDNSGNIYICGVSPGTWGTPVRGYSGNSDAFVACLDNDGNLLWNTFLGGGGTDYAYSIVLDESNNVYFIGGSYSTWGSPVRAHFGSGADAMVACLDSSGNLTWHTFLGGTEWEEGYGIFVQNAGNVYVTGVSDGTWGSPVRSYNDREDAFLACLNRSGVLQWNTFAGSDESDLGKGVVVDDSGRVFMTGNSKMGWGDEGSENIFLAAFDSNGNPLWNRFYGSIDYPDYGNGIALDSSGHIYILGSSQESWGSPVSDHTGVYNAVCLCLDSVNGDEIWHTYLGSSNDTGEAIALDNSGNIYIMGNSDTGWGSPVNGHSGSYDAFLAVLNSKALRNWRISAKVFSGRGTVSPESQFITDGSEARIYISPDYGYRIGQIIDNGNSMPISNPYVLNGVDRHHEVQISFVSESYTVTALVIGGHGMVSPAQQLVAPGDQTTIQILPDNGYKIKSVFDNGREVDSFNSYYLINNVRSDHEVKVHFEPVSYPPTINLTCLRLTVQAWIIRREVGDIRMYIKEHPTNSMVVSKYLLYRTDSAGQTELASFTGSGSHSFIDKNLKKGETATYRVEALDSSGQVIAESTRISI